VSEEPQAEYRLTLRAMPGWPAPPPTRLRHALKAFLRQYGFRCTDLQELPRQPAQPGPQAAPPRPGRLVVAHAPPDAPAAALALPRPPRFHHYDDARAL
jgi:hypothetical protein